jgi:HEAT repeat protein
MTMTSETAEARELLLQAVAPIASDLVAVFDRLVAARRAVGLYQEDHPIAVAARDDACMALETALRERGTLTITATELGLLIDGKAYRQNADTEALAKRLRQRGILSIVFKAGLDFTELSVLLALMDLSASRLRARGGLRHILQTSGVMHIDGEEISYTEEAPTPEQQTEADPLDVGAKWDEIIAALAKLLVSPSDEIDEETYQTLLTVLGDSAIVVRLLTECLAQAGAQIAESGRAGFVGQMVQKLERVVLARSSTDWENVKATVRQAVAKLPPAIRPRIFTFHPGALGQGPPGPDEVVAAPTQERVPELLSELSGALAEASNLPRELASDYVGLERGDQALGLIGADARVPASRLAMLLNGMASMNLQPQSPWEEMTEMLQSARGHTTLADAVAALLEILDKENKLDGYSKVATELERKTRELIDRGQRGPALHALAYFAQHANETNRYPAWQRLRAKAALEAIGSDAILKFVSQIIRTATPEQAETATELLIFLGEAAAPMLTQLMAEPLEPGAETSVAAALVRLGDTAVPELCRTLQSGYTQVGQAVVRVLSRIATPAALKGLGKALSVRDVLVRLAAVQALGKTSAPEAVEVLLAALADGYPSIRRAAIAALGDLKSVEGVPHLSRLALRRPGLFRRSSGDQIEAICSLGKIGGGQAIQNLAGALNMKSLFASAKVDEIRLAAAAALKRIGTPECLDLLASHTNDRRPAVRAACLQMFEELQASQPKV